MNLFFILLLFSSVLILFVEMLNKNLKKEKGRVDRAKIIKIFSFIAIFALFGIIFSLPTKTPTLIISEPKDGATIESSKITVKGKVKPSNSKVTINKKNIKVNNNGSFTYGQPLGEGENQITIEANNSVKSVEQTLKVTRIITEEEKAKINAIAKEKNEKEYRDKADKEKADREKAEEEARAIAEAEANRPRTKEEIYAQVKLGMSKQQVTDIAKKQPDDKQEMNTAYGNSAFWYFRDNGWDFNMLQIGFDGSRVTSINKW